MRPAHSRFLTIISGILVLAFVTLSAHAQAFATDESIFGESILLNFDQSNGSFPSALVRDSAGNLYGTTMAGGDPLNGPQLGTAFELLPPKTSGESWQEIILWNFGNGTDGWDPQAALVRDASGNLYGTTSRGGVDGEGTALELSPPSSRGAAWTETILWNFTKGADGGEPLAPLIFFLNTSSLLGTTNIGGVNGGGTAFELTPPTVAGAGWTESTLWSFGKGADGAQPAAGLIADRIGYTFYGTTSSGGAYFNGSAGQLGGTVFRLSAPTSGGKRWGEKVLWSFCGSTADGCAPVSPLMLDTAGNESGNLYGTTQYGGPNGCGLAPAQDVGYPIYQCGTAFQLARTSNNLNATWAESVIWNFGSGTDGYLPQAGLIKVGEPGSCLYGTTARGGIYANPLPQNPGGTAFELCPLTTGAANEKILWNFGGFAGDTEFPSALVFGPNQTTLYGAGAGGGDPGDGTVFQVIIPD